MTDHDLHSIPDGEDERHDRRGFLSGLCCGALGAAALMLPTSLAAAAPRADVKTVVLRPGAPRPPAARVTARTLSLRHLHTGEDLRVTYWANGRYIPGATSRLNYFLRDWRNNQVKRIDPRLFDLLFDLRRKMDSSQPFEIVSAYRSPQTNAMLAAEFSGVARNSLHMQGMAADVILPGRDVSRLRRAAVAMKRGGVGYYSERFVHLDVGPVRSWG